ncbi:MAG: GGDEF domain-containing protein [Nitrospinae bacterium]|nr:GGDEF domain-containing protein [Nitrospinota bacterium]
MNKRVYHLAIIGMGKGGTKLAQIFHEDAAIKLVGVSNRNQSVPGMNWARENGVFTTGDYRELLKIPGLDIVMDASGNQEVREYLEGHHNKIEVVGGAMAHLVWRLVEERENRERESLRNLEGQQRLYEIGLRLSTADKSESALKMIISAGMEILSMAAGSAALFDEEKGMMRMAATIGFDGKQVDKLTWNVKPGGLTSHILSTKGPTIINDINDNHTFDTSRLKADGVKSLIAVPLVADGRIVGILYVDDFSPRYFTEYDINLMSLLGTLAASAVEKVITLEKAEEMAVTDELTKVNNHRYFVRALTAELKRAERYGENLGLIMIDVDFFKVFNDTHGHLMGNEVLIVVSSILKQFARETDVVARYGGEEFALVLPKTSKVQAAQLAERLRAAVEAHPVPGAKSQPGGKLTISLGVAVFPDDWKTSDDPSSFLGLADAAMYRSKGLGKNRVTLHSA